MAILAKLKNLPEYTHSLAKVAYERGEREFLVAPRYPMVPKNPSHPTCGNWCATLVHFHHRDSGYLLVSCAYCLLELRGGLYEIGIRESKPKKNRNFSDWDRYLIMTRDGVRCFRCGVRPHTDELEVDHIIPHAQGGPTSIENGITLCRACNQAKSNKFDGGLVIAALNWTHMTTEQRAGEMMAPEDIDALYKASYRFFKSWRESSSLQ